MLSCSDMSHRLPCYFELHQRILTFRRKRRLMAIALGVSPDQDLKMIGAQELTTLYAVQSMPNQTIRSVAMQLSFDPSWTSRLIAALTKEGFLQLRISGNDRREKEVSITERGRQVFAHALKMERVIMEQALQPISSIEVNKLTDFITLLADRLKAPYFPNYNEGHPLFMQLMRITRGLELLKENYLNTGLSLMELELINLIANSSEPYTILELAQRMPYDLSTISRTLKRLTKQGLIISKIVKTDLRKRTLTLTRRGISKINVYAERVEMQLASLFKSTDHDEIDKIVNTNEILAKLGKDLPLLAANNRKISTEIKELSRHDFLEFKNDFNFDIGSLSGPNADIFGYYSNKKIKGTLIVKSGINRQVHDFDMSAKGMSAAECREFIKSVSQMLR